MAGAADPAPGAIRFAVFETAIGWAGLAWGEAGLIGALLPEPDRDAALSVLRRRFPKGAEVAPPEGERVGHEFVIADAMG